MGVLEAQVAGTAISVAHSVLNSSKQGSARRSAKEDATALQTKLDAKENSEAINLKESKKRTALGLQRARAGGTDRVFKGGTQSSAGTGVGLSSTLG